MAGMNVIIKCLWKWRGWGAEMSLFKRVVDWGKKLFKHLVVLVQMDLNLRPDERGVNRE